MNIVKKLELSLVLAALLAGGNIFAAEDVTEEATQDVVEEQAAQEGADVTAAVDPTSAQWAFQFAYQQTPDWHRDTLSNGQTRPEGLDNFFQFRLVAPFVFDTWTLLPRVTIRHYEAPNGESGWGNTEIFGLIMPKSWDWGSGRVGIGPLITLPGDEEVARDEFGYGIAGALVNGSGKWFYGVLVTQTWRAVDRANLPLDQSDTNPLGIAPILTYQLGGGWYLSNGDMVIQYDWSGGDVYMPLAIRIGKVVPASKGVWNVYFEYKTALIYENWQGAAEENTFRVNITRQIPSF